MAITRKIWLISVVCILAANISYGAKNPALLSVPDNGDNVLPAVFDWKVCNVGALTQYISNSTVERATGTNNWTIMLGDDILEHGSMRWNTPQDYAAINDYLYLGSLRIGYHGRIVHLSTDTSPGVDETLPPQSLSDYDTHFYISDQSELVPPEYRINVAVHQNTYAWSEHDANDFIIYQYWIVNLNSTPLDSVYVALHADCDVSAAEGGSGYQSYSRDDLVGYLKDDINREYISYMYDGDNPTVPGDDEGGNKIPKESRGYIGSRLLYCPPRVGESDHSIQSGHGWWDWNSDPASDSEYFQRISDGQWLPDPPSPHDFRFLQKTGPFAIGANDSIRVVFALGIGNGLTGLRSNLDNAHMLFLNDFVYHNLAPEPPQNLRANVLDQNIELNWDANTGDDDVSGYFIYSATEPGGPFQWLNQVPIDTNYYLYTPAVRDLYYIYVTSVDSEGVESIPSDIVMVSTLPPPPSDFRAIPGNQSIALSWSTVENATAYRIYRSNVSGGPYAQIAERAHPDSSFTDYGLNPAQPYFYVATTVKWGVESPYTGEVQAIPNGSGNGRVLLIDDGYEMNPNGTAKENRDVTRFYQRWGVYNFDYDIWKLDFQGMPSAEVLSNYQAVLFASDADANCQADPNYHWWFDVGAIGGGSLRTYLQANGHLLAVGSQILSYVFNTNPPMPGDFDYEWLGINTGPDTTTSWDSSNDFTWAIGTHSGYPDSMKIDVALNPNQRGCASFINTLRPGADSLFLMGLNVDGMEPPGYRKPIGIIYRPGGVSKTSLFNFDLHFMPHNDVQTTITNVLRDEFGCTFYENPAPLPPWHLAVRSLGSANLQLTWDRIDENDVNTIKIYRLRDDGSYNLLFILSGDATQFNDTDISPGSTYRYKLTCVDFAGQEGRFSCEVSELGGRPPALTGFQVEAGDGFVRLSWDSTGTTDLAGLKIYRKLDSDSFIVIDTIPANLTTFSDNSVENGHGYYYSMTALSIYGPESYSTDTLYAFPVSPEQRSGILIVNGVDWTTYNPQVYDMYNARAFTGTLGYSLWDLFEVSPESRPYPETVIGDGAISPTDFNPFATIIWVGNAYGGDLEKYQLVQDELLNYLNSGGNLVLVCRMGQSFLSPGLMEYGHVTSFNTGVNFTTLVSQNALLTNINRTSSQSFTDLVQVDTSAVSVLYRADSYPEWVAGFWAHPANSGNLMYLGCRPYRLDFAAMHTNFETILRSFLGMTGVDDNKIQLPQEYSLFQNYPNPFNPSTTIKFGLPAQSHVSIRIYDILGRSVRLLIDQDKPAGYHEIVWDGKNEAGIDATTGIYFAKLIAADKTSNIKMVLLK